MLNNDPNTYLFIISIQNKSIETICEYKHGLITITIDYLLWKRQMKLNIGLIFIMLYQLIKKPLP